MFIKPDFSFPYSSKKNMSDYQWNIELNVTENRSEFVLNVEPRLYSQIFLYGFDWGTYIRETPFGHIITFIFSPFEVSGHMSANFDVMCEEQFVLLKNFINQSQISIVLRDNQQPNISTKFEWKFDADKRQQLEGLVRKCVDFNSKFKAYDYNRASDFLDQLESWPFSQFQN